MSFIVPQRVAASTFDVFGLGSESTALAGAVTARASDFSAAYYNPAGLVFGGSARQASFGMTSHLSRLSLRGQNISISDPVGIEIGVRAPLPLSGVMSDRLHLGLALHLLPTNLVHVVAHVPSDAFFPYYDNRTQRIVILPALGVRVTRRLALGIGLNLFAGLAGKVATAEGASRTLEPRIDEKISPLLRVHAGLRFEATERLALALAFRQGFAVPFRTETQNRVAGSDIDIAVEAEGLFSPDQIWAGGALRPSDAVTLSLDAGYLRWSAWRGPYVAVSSVLPIAGSFSVDPPPIQYSDIYSLRAGGEWAVFSSERSGLKLRAGLGYEPSPIPDQPGVTNMIDGGKIIFGVGAGMEWKRLLPTPLRIDAHVMGHVVGSRTLVKRVASGGGSTCPAEDQVCGLHDEVPDDPSDPATSGIQIGNPGYPSIEGGGTVWQAGLTLTVAM